ncbi:amino acid adenylation domain-containing protein [Flavobacteriaceae bacterium F89]|uniref:Amino acid adenylation domain-containing protein n=1 Tax=Cerina litoralis TaxID=2874477 RepID=A0AAE3JPV6_9FLAO|nr:amino acid adenylation domain-containing protein [Cerina litoralis]MCG2461189.1 amino acid adenylation domain-containing protein [Cerina litoralis]
MKINLIEYFENTVDLFSGKVALVDANSELTFEKLQIRAKYVAVRIAQKNRIINRPIAIYLPKSNEAIVSFLATLYSGNCYAPLDTKNPISRIKSILQVLDPICIVTNNTYIANIKKCGLDIDIINLDELDLEKTNSIELNYNECIDVDPAYIIHTSGSTGVPKGVAISHRSIFDYINWAIDTFNITEMENIGNQAPFIFDNSTLDIYLMMFTGATLYLIPEQHFMFPVNLLEYLETKRINFIFWVPSVLINIANLKLLNSSRIPTVKKVLFAGEVMPTKHLNYWIQNLDKKVLFANLYGPTEITVDCTYHIVDRKYSDDEVLPIGKPCRNSDVLILNNENNIAKIGEHGELCVRGSSLSLGYWNNFERTKSFFTQNPLNKSYPEKIYRTGDIVYVNKKSEIIYVGRKDFQIKHLGYRIELGEIEHSILSVFNSINVCVLYDQSKGEIVLIYESKEEIPNSEFRIKLANVLSKYMIPTRYVKLDQLPTTNSGKIDRVYLNRSIIME